jgi:transcriptional regulator with XRE-family HTH domain
MNRKSDFPERLKSLIEEKGCSQRELAEQVGVKPNTVSDWMKHGTSPKVSTIYEMAKYFNVSFDYLFTGRHDAYNPNVVVLTDNELELLTHFRKLSEKEQYILIGVILNESRRSAVQDDEEKNAI